MQLVLEKETIAQSKKLVFKFNDAVHQMTFDILFNQIEKLLQDVPSLSVCWI